MPSNMPIRVACPPGACACGREALLADPSSDQRILWLTKAEESKLLERLESVASLDELRRMQVKMQDLLGMTVHIAPGPNEVRTVRGFLITIDDMPGLCSKTKQTIPAAIRRCLDRHPEIAYAILNENDLLAGA